MGQEPAVCLTHPDFPSSPPTPSFSGNCDADDAAQAAAPKRWGKSRPFPALVSAVEGLCTLSSKDDKNTFRVEFSLGDSGLAYLPGDALGIYPTNCSKVGLLGVDLPACLGDSGLAYLPGDALGIYPTNCSKVFIQ